jgi:MBG domain-containing protein/Big-like domain-containing protein/VCBS repeat protein/CARDB protein
MRRTGAAVVFAVLILMSLAQGQTTTSTTLTVSASAPGVPSTVTMTASVSPAETGLVQFNDGNTLLATSVLDAGNATYKTFGLAAGSHSLTANFVGTTTAAASSSAPSILTLNPGVTATSLAITGGNPINLGSAAQLTATVSANWAGVLNGSVSLLDSGSSITSASLGTPVNTFATSQTIPTTSVGGSPFIIAMADVNGDGIPDLLTTSSSSNLVSVFLGNGNGTFTLKSSTPTVNPGNPRGIAIGDFFQHGMLDFAVVSDTSTAIEIWEGNNNGTFTSKNSVSLPSGSVPWGIATADLNHDGILDLIVADSASNAITVFLGNGNGTFQTGTTIPLTTVLSGSNGPKFLTAAPLFGTGNMDLAVADYSNSRINLLQGNGDGTFKSAQTVITTSTEPETIVAADLIGNGLQDLVVTNYGANTVTVFLNKGSGVFAAGVSYATGLNPYDVAVADINGDGKPDLVVTNRNLNHTSGDDTVGMLLGNGNGTFQAMTTYPTAEGPVGVVVGNFTGGGQPDLAVVDYDAGEVTVVTQSTSAQAALTTSSLPAGSNSLTAQYAGNASFAGSISSSVTQTVNQGASVTSLSAPSNLYYGSPITLTATVSGPGGIVPTGTVTLYNNGSSTGSSASLSNGTALITLPVLQAGTYTAYTAVYSGDSNYTGSASSAPTFTVQKATPTVTWPTASSIIYGNALSFSTLTGGSASVGSASVPGSFAFTTQTIAPTAGAALQNVTFTPTDITDYNTVTGTVSVTVNQATAVVQLSNLTQTYSGSAEPVSVSTTPSPLVLNYSYTGIDGTSYPSSTTAPTNPGTYSVVATVFDPNYIGQGSGTLTINQLSPALNFALNSGAPATTPYGTTVYFALGMASTPLCPTGNVQFYVDGAASGSPVTLSGTSCTTPVPFQTATLTNGTHSIYAIYSGDTYYQGGTSGTVSYTVTPDTTTVTLATSGTSVNVGQAATFTATVTPAPPASAAPAGTVQFFDGSNNLIGTSTLSATLPYTASYSTSALAAGSHSISATFVDSDGNFAGNSSSVDTETVNLIVPTIQWTPSPTEFVYGTALGSSQLNATGAVDPNTGNSVAGSFAYNFPSGNVLPMGTVNLIATFTPSDPTTYSSNSATFTITVDPAPLTVTANNASMVYGQSLPSLSYTVAGFVNNDPSTVVNGLASCSTTATSSSAVTSYPINCIQGTLAATNYTFQFVSGTLTVTHATPTITWATPTAISYGTALSATQLNAASGGVAGSFVYTPAAGAVLKAGPQTLSVTFTPTDTTDYTSPVTSTVNLTVTKATPAITWATPAAITYGTALSTTQFNATSGSVAGSFVYTPAVGAVLPAGSQTLSETFTPTDTADYNAATTTVALTVSPQALSISPNSYSRAVGAANPAFTGTVTGAVNNDLANNNLVVTYSTPATASSQIGTYLITATISGPAAASYTLTDPPGTLTVLAQGVDLMESAVSGPSSAASGGTIQVTDTVKNQGIANAAGSLTGFYLSVDGVTKNYYIGNRSAAAVSAGTISGPVTTTLTVPTSMNGTYYVIACTNYNYGITESNTANNCTASASFPLAGADLIENAVSVLTSTPVSGGSLQVSDTAVDQGAGNAGASLTGFYLSVNGTAKNYYIGNRSVGTLTAAGGSTGAVTTTLTLPINLNGTYYLIACANYNNGLVESNTANNCTASASFTLAGADLTESGVTVLTTTAVLGGSVQVADTAQTAVTGGSAGASLTGFYLSVNGTSKNYYIGNRSVGALTPGGSSVSASTTLTLPTSLIGGNYYVVACANYNNSLVESNTANNCTASSNTVLVP